MKWECNAQGWTSTEPGRYTATITGGPGRYGWHVHMVNGDGVGYGLELADAKRAAARALRVMEGRG